VDSGRIRIETQAVTISLGLPQKKRGLFPEKEGGLMNSRRFISKSIGYPTGIGQKEEKTQPGNKYFNLFIQK